MLRAENVTVRYGAQTVVNGLSFELRAGQWLMLVGPNGAGKSTLIEAIAQGVPYTGRISLEGRDIRALKGAERARSVGFLAQKNAVSYAYSVEEVVSLGRYAHASGFLSARDDEGEASPAASCSARFWRRCSRRTRSCSSSTNRRTIWI